MANSLLSALFLDKYAAKFDAYSLLDKTAYYAVFPAPFSPNIKNFDLITNNVKADSTDAKEIMQVKRKLPLAMQGKDSALFNEILAKGFTMRGEKEFLNRSDYIKNRVAGTWTIDTVKYQNLALQFFGDIAVLTYRNILNGTDDFGKADTEYYSWADIYIKENGKWKIGAIHNIDARIEYISK